MDSTLNMLRVGSCPSCRTGLFITAQNDDRILSGVADAVASSSDADSFASMTDAARPVDPFTEDIELSRVLAFIDNMPTWSQQNVMQVKQWLSGQLADQAHRRA